MEDIKKLSNEEIKDRIDILLHPKSPSLSASVITGTKNGFLVGIGVGITMPLLLRGRVEPVGTFLKSVINATFIGTTFMATSHILQYQLMMPPVSSYTLSGIITGGTSAGLLARSNFAKGMFTGGLFGAIGYLSYKKIYQDEINQSLLNDINELKSLVNENTQIELSPRDNDLFEKLIKGIDNRMNDPSYNKKINDTVTFSSIFKSLNPLKEISEEEKKLIIQKNKEKNNSVILDLKGKTTNAGYTYNNNTTKSDGDENK